MSAIQWAVKHYNLEILCAVPVGERWDEHEHYKSAIVGSDMVLINGEGTIHHDAPAGLALLRLARFAKFYGVKSALINCTYDSNGELAGQLLSEFDYVFVRESRSLNQAKKAGVEALLVPDLTFFRPTSSFEERALVGAPLRGFYTDSVDAQLTRILHAAYKGVDGLSYLSIFNGNQTTLNAGGSIRARLVQNYKKLSILGLIAKIVGLVVQKSGRSSPVIPLVAENHIEYDQVIKNAEYVICGRFHAMCYCIANGTPFVALPSNSCKVEGVLEDCGLELSSNRLMSKFEAEQAVLVAKNPLSSKEKSLCASYANEANKKIQNMFETLFGRST